MMQIHPIRSDADHEAALARVAELWGAATDTPEGDELDVLTTLIDAYEARRWPISALDPVDAIKAAMAADGYSRKELAGLIGQPRATEILARRRHLTLPMIRKISKSWHVPAQILVQDYPLVA